MSMTGTAPMSSAARALSSSSRTDMKHSSTQQKLTLEVAGLAPKRVLALALPAMIPRIP
jgi:hypothetical protein